MALDLAQVWHAFGSFEALQNVHLHVPRGELVGFLGHNGAGKTTAMRIALGLLRANAGEVIVDGVSLAADPARVRGSLGAIIETPGFHGRLDGRANLVRLARMRGLSYRAARQATRRALERVGLGGVDGRGVHAYSLGMRQRLGLAYALLFEPRYLLLDEPMSGLDPEGIAELREVLVTIAREDGVGVLVSSHQLTELEGIVTRATVIAEGRILADGPVRELLDASRSGVRLELAAADEDRAIAALGGRPHERVGSGNDAGSSALLLPDLKREQVPAVVRDLVHAEVAVQAIAPPERRLEDFYLRMRAASRDREQASELAAKSVQATLRAVAAAPEPDPLAAAPWLPWSLLRVVRSELARVVGSVGGLALLFAPALVAFWSTQEFLSAEAELLQQATVEGQASVSEPNAFLAVSAGLRLALPILIAVALGLGSLAVSSERGRGTLRNLALLPIRRWVLFSGKVLAGCLWLTASWALAVWVTRWSAERASEFRAPGDWVFGSFIEIAPIDEIWPVYHQLMTAPLMWLFAFYGLGALIGGFVRNGAPALSLALGSWLFLDLVASLARGWSEVPWVADLRSALPTSWAPGFIEGFTAGRDWIAYYNAVAKGAGDALWQVGGDPHLSLLPGTLLCLLLAALLFLSREIR